MRMIDADQLLSRIRLNYNNHQDVTAMALKDIIDTTPTAYDVDKVVEELKKQSFIDNELNKVVDLDEAIEIIKAGIKND